MSPHDDVDMESVYSQFCASVEGDATVIFQNTQRLSAKDDLFYTSVSIQSAVTLRAMLDSGSMACSLSSRVLPLLETSNIVSSDSISPTSVVLIGCGVPTLIVDGQSDDLILGSNVIKHLTRVLKTSDDFWDKVSLPDKSAVDDENLLQLLASVEKWRGSEMPDKVGTVKLKHAVTLEPMKEHLVWGRLPSHECLSAGSTVIVEPSESRTVPRTVMVGRIVTPIWGDRWVPVRVINPSNKSVNLRRNCKLADVSPCTALEDFDNDYLYANAKTDNVKCNVRSFLGMVGFYQQFFEGYSSISKPLFALTSGMRKPQHAKGKRNAPVSRKLTSDDWTPECSGAFRTLKQALLDNVTLAHPDFSKPFLLSVDASSNGLGAVLSQLADGDDDAFRWSCEPPAMLHTQCHSTVASRAVVSAVLEQSLDQDKLPPQAFLLPQLVQSVQPPELSEVCPLPGNKLMDAQCADPCLSRVLLFVERQRRPSRREHSHEPVEALRFLRHWDKLTVKTEKDLRYVVPSVLREKVLKGVHDEAGHQGQRRTLYLNRQRFFWHGMERDVRDYVKCCRRCVCSKSPEPEARAHLESVTTSRPLELICIDFWSAEDSSNKSLDVLVVTDHFTKLVQAYLCPNQSAKVVAQQLWNNFFCV
ncbi:Retrovirus-related Pol polyprotein from transposon gypsy [Merluccius polli]|uniref:Gypsy retrotransposon integrase-like protein 1 n=1 Tax=Merluccius polli TaxID=89951 RepID=A0AA47N927_MERPO|nr:Retrovirus-related Pol polyprotein from transposon gypsy [Merluccius polli]